VASFAEPKALHLRYMVDDCVSAIYSIMYHVCVVVVAVAAVVVVILLLVMLVVVVAAE
jgi:hypothetical protein